MIKPPRKFSGFTVIEVILGVVFISVIGLIFWKVASHSKQTNSNQPVVKASQKVPTINSAEDLRNAKKTLANTKDDTQTIQSKLEQLAQ